jgi:phospholipid/cholesterol/gamma-HCH transport system substrate-binding protein
MPRTRSLAFSELKIGIIGVSSIALAVVLIIAVGGQAGCFWQQFRVRTKFANVQGMKSGAIVRVSGKDVGKVTSVEFSGEVIDVGIALNEDVRPLVTAGSKASLGSLSLLGEPIVEITAAPGGAPLADNAYLESTGTGSPIADMAAKASSSLEQANLLITDLRSGKGTLGKLFADEAAYNNLNSLLTEMNKVTAALHGTRGTAGKLLNDAALHDSLKKAVDDLDAVLVPLKSTTSPLGKLINDEAMGKTLNDTVNNMNSMSAKLGRNDSTVGALLNERVLYDKLNGTIERVDKLVATLQSTNGSAGKFMNDPALFDNANATMKEFQALLAEIRKDPKKYLRISVSIF